MNAERAEMKSSLALALLVAALSLFAERQPYERYQSIVDRQMFGRPPVGFDPTVPPSSVTKAEQKELTREQEAIKSAIHFSAINVTPDGATAVGFTDNADSKNPVHYYLKVGEERNGWKVVEADPLKATMTIAKNEVTVSLSLGANSAQDKNATSRDAGASAALPGRRAGLLGTRTLPSAGGGDRPDAVSFGGSLRARREARERERQAEEEKERIRREEQRKELQQLKDEIKAERDAAAKEREEREAERAARAEQEAREREARERENNKVDADAEDDI